MNNCPNRTLSILIHAVVWVGGISMPYLAAYVSGASYPRFDPVRLMLPIQVLFLFYLNYLWLINRFLFKKEIIWFLSINLLIIVGLTLFSEAVHHFLPPPHLHLPPKPMSGAGRPPIDMRMFTGVLIELLVVGLSVAIRMTRKWYEAHRLMQELEQANIQAELQQLKSQLNPHFLFNSLNSIYALIGFKPEQAQEVLHSLCDMLRYQLYEANRDLIPLEKEIDFVRNYCDLMRLRLSPNVTCRVELPRQTTGIYLSPLLFISIVENAFKHGVSQSNPSHITIHISVELGEVSCCVRNSFHSKRENNRHESGIGLENLRRRLELLYPQKHTFHAERCGVEFVAELILQTTL